MYFYLIRILNSGLSHVAEHFYTFVFVQSTSPTTAELLKELMVLGHAPRLGHADSADVTLPLP